MKKYVTTRKVYKAVKKYDHQQFDDFCTRVYMNGYEDGKKSSPRRGCRGNFESRIRCERCRPGAGRENKSRS